MLDIDLHIISSMEYLVITMILHEFIIENIAAVLTRNVSIMIMFRYAL